MVIGVVLTVIIWASFGPVWGVLTGVLFVGGFGWKFLFAVGGALGPNREDKQEFVGAWEARSGEMQFGRSRTYPPGGAYKRWVTDRTSTGESAASWMDRTICVSPGAPIYGYQGQATNASRRTLYPWQSSAFKELRHALRAVKEPGGGLEWQELTPVDTGYFESIAFVLNKQLGWDKSLGQRYLGDLADGLAKESSIDSAVDYLMAEGRRTLMRLRGSDPRGSQGTCLLGYWNAPRLHRCRQGICGCAGACTRCTEGRAHPGPDARCCFTVSTGEDRRLWNEERRVRSSNALESRL
jgi:hypothetical protein